MSLLLSICYSTPSYPIVDPFGDHALGCPRSLPYRITFWHDPLRNVYASIGRMVGLRTRTEVSGMALDNSKRQDTVYSSDKGQEIIAGVVICLPVLVSATTNICVRSATTIHHRRSQRFWYHFQTLSFEPKPCRPSL